MRYSLALHIIGIVMWLGGLLILTRMMSSLEKLSKESLGLVPIIKKIFYGWILGGLFLTALTGLYQIGIRGISFYMKQGWFHSKLTLVLLLVGVTVALGLQVSKASRGDIVKSKSVMILHGLSAVGLVSIVFLTMLGRV